MTISVVNMIPASLSGESSQDSEPSIVVNPQTPTRSSVRPSRRRRRAGRTRRSTSRPTAVPAGRCGRSSGQRLLRQGDISVAFGSTGGVLYAGILNGQTIKLQILRSANFTSTTPMTVLVTRANRGPALARRRQRRRQGRLTRPRLCRQQRLQPARGGNGHGRPVREREDRGGAGRVRPAQIEKRATTGQDGPPVRLALHSDGTVYAAIERWVSGTVPNINLDVVVTRDDNWATTLAPFAALHRLGRPQAAGSVSRRTGSSAGNDVMGQERLAAT